MEKLKNIIINRLKAIREEKGLTHADMAEIIQMERASYTQIETGKNMLSIENLVKIVDELGKSASYILGRGEVNLSPDELELVEVYRSLPDIEAREIAIKLIKGWRCEAVK